MNGWNPQSFLWEWFKWVLVLAVFLHFAIRPLTYTHVIVMAALCAAAFFVADQIKAVAASADAVVVESFADEEAADKEAPLADLPEPPKVEKKQGTAKKGSAGKQEGGAGKQKKGGIDPVDPKAVPKKIRRNPDYGLSFMPPAEWKVPQPHPPVCIQEKKCPVCPTYSGYRDNLPYSVIAAGLPETQVGVEFDKSKERKD